MKTSIPFTPLSARFFRAVFSSDMARAPDGVPNSEGRCHHAVQRAIYMSPSPETAAVAVSSHVKPDDPVRVTVPVPLE